MPDQGTNQAVHLGEAQPKVRSTVLLKVATNITEEKMSKEITNSLKGIAILFVLFGHTNFLDSSGAWGVHIFLLLSGYGLECSYQKNGIG